MTAIRELIGVDDISESGGTVFLALQQDLVLTVAEVHPKFRFKSRKPCCHESFESRERTSALTINKKDYN